MMRRTKDPTWTWVEDSLNRVSLPPNDQAEYQRRPNPEKDGIDFGQRKRSQRWKGSYRWNTLCQLPPDLRERLLFDLNVPVTQLDISCSFGIMLPWLFADEVENKFKKGKIDRYEKESLIAECNRLRAFLSDGDFYRALASDVPRDEAKGGFQRYLNAQKPDTAAKNIGRVFSESFPTVGKMLSRRKASRSLCVGAPKKEEKSSVFQELQGRQNEIIQAVIRKCREHGIPCIPVWDELVVPYKYRMQVIGWMHSELFMRTGVRAKVGGIRMENPQNDVTPCPALEHLPQTSPCNSWLDGSRTLPTPALPTAGEKAKDGPSRAPRDGERCRLDLTLSTIGEWVFDLDGDTISRAGLGYLLFDPSVK